MKKIIILSIAITVLTCCTLDREGKVNQGNLIEVDFKNFSLYQSDTSIFKSIRYVPLETNENSLIGEIGKIIYSNGIFYIFDHKKQIILLFDESGNHLGNVGSVGRGPGEYVSIRGFDVDSEGNIYIWDVMSNKLVVYDENPINYREYRLGKGVEEFIVAGDGYLIVRNLLDQGMIKSRIAGYDYINDETEELLSTGYYYDDFDITRFGAFSFFKSENRAFFNARFKNEVYEISDNGNIKKAIIINDPVNSHEAVNYLKTEPFVDYKFDQFIVDIRDIYENSKVISMTIQKGGLNNLLISKLSGYSLLLPHHTPPDRNYFGSWPIRGVAGEEFFSVFWSRGQQNEMWQKAVNRSSLEFNQKQILLNRKIEDNPVLVLFKFKDF